MGQAIAVESSVAGSSVVYSTDRSITGQDGTSYTSAEAAAGDDRFPGRLAARLFDADGRLSSVFVASNSVVVSGEGSWDAERVDALGRVISDFFVFYREG